MATTDPLSGLELTEDQRGVTLAIVVAPRASRPRIGPLLAGRLKVAVTAPPVDSKANQAVVALLARTLRVRATDITIVSGCASKRKRVRIVGMSARGLQRRLVSTISAGSTGLSGGA